MRLYNAGSWWLHSGVAVKLWLKHERQEVTIRTIFTIEVKLDIAVNDDERRKAFIELLTKTSRQLYAQAAMLSGNNMSPKVSITEESQGMREDIALFGKEKNK